MVCHPAKEESFTHWWVTKLLIGTIFVIFFGTALFTFKLLTGNVYPWATAVCRYLLNSIPCKPWCQACQEVPKKSLRKYFSQKDIKSQVLESLVKISSWVKINLHLHDVIDNWLLGKVISSSHDSVLNEYIRQKKLLSNSDMSKPNIWYKYHHPNYILHAGSIKAQNLNISMKLQACKTINNNWI